MTRAAYPGTSRPRDPERLPRDAPWFVACVESEAEFQVFGPLWTYEDAEHEAAQDYNPGAECGNKHLISHRLTDGVIPRLPMYYSWSVDRFADGDRAIDWLRDRGWTPRQLKEAKADA